MGETLADNKIQKSLFICLFDYYFAWLVFTSIFKPAFQFKLFNNVGENRIFVLVKN